MSFGYYSVRCEFSSGVCAVVFWIWQRMLEKRFVIESVGTIGRNYLSEAARRSLVVRSWEKFPETFLHT